MAETPTIPSDNSATCPFGFDAQVPPASPADSLETIEADHLVKFPFGFDKPMPMEDEEDLVFDELLSEEDEIIGMDY